MQNTIRRMRRPARIAACLVFLVALSGCATLTGGPNQRIRIDGVPEGATLTVTNQRGEVVYEGAVPDSLKLRRFVEVREAARYRARFEHPDFQPRDVMIDPSHRTIEAAAPWILGPTIILAWVPAVGSLTDLVTQSSVRLKPNRIENIEMLPVAQATTVEEVRP